METLNITVEYMHRSRATDFARARPYRVKMAPKHRNWQMREIQDYITINVCYVPD